MTLHFTVLSAGKRPSTGQLEAYLIQDEWDDWFRFSTQYYLIIFDSDGTRHDVGTVKIGEFGMRHDQRRPAIPDEFELLDETFFSLGQDENYYNALSALGPDVRGVVLASLRDCAAIPGLLDKALGEDVTRISLLRSVSRKAVELQFRRLAQGDAPLTSFEFSYTAPPQKQAAAPPLKLEFSVTPDSQPPTNIHVLVGRNGVGKTYVLRHMAQAFVHPGASARRVGAFSASMVDGESFSAFASLVSVTFSAFDPFEKVRAQGGEAKRSYSYIGLQRPPSDEGKSQAPKSPGALRKEFVAGMRACRLGGEVARLRRALQTLEADPLFRDAQVTELSDLSPSAESEWEMRARQLFDRLSSGHKIVLLTVTKLVEVVDERTLVLLDEPEAHLHPPLLSAFVRALSDLLVQRNGVAIVATHSPVVLQEVPRTCVWILRRSGAEAVAERPGIETFGENVGVLTREAFGLEVTESGFHKLLRDVVDSDLSFQDIVQQFDGQLGAEARAIVRGLTITRDSPGNQ